MLRPLVRSCCLLSLFGFVFLALPLSESAAQQQQTTTWTVPGANYTYEPGVVPWSIDAPCPFGAVASDPVMGSNGNPLYDAATKDRDGCPYAEGTVPVAVGSGTRTMKVPLRGCGAYYESLEVNATATAGSAAPPHAASVKKRFCHLPMGERDYQARKLMRVLANRSEALELAMQTNTVLPGITPPEHAKEINTKIEEEKKAEKQCFDDSLKKIGDYWAKQQQIACVKSVRAAIKQMKFDYEQEIKASTSEQSTQGGSSSQTQGTSPGAVFSTPSIWGGLISAVKSVAFNAASLIKLATAIADVLDYLTEGCEDLNNKINDIINFRKTVLNGLCQAAENLIERQLTQCIRVNLSIDYDLPRFQVLLQCPLRINAYLNVRPGSINKGFNCFTQSPITGGAASALSGDGGLRKLFDGSCFESSADSGNNGGNNGGGPSGGTRIPGIDCGQLADAAIYKQNIQGQIYLAGGPARSEGWSAGETESAAAAPAGNGVTPITRCDFYMGGKRMKTTYVYGTGNSCNEGPNGFLSNGLETNTACYPSGGYTPKEAPNIPDACLYPSGCLDNSGKFNSSLLGTGNCPANASPVFNPAASYKVTSGGVGGTTETRSCSEFDPTQQQNVTCCDPQVQDCRNATNICACDNGDPTNTLQSGGGANPPYPLACQNGGNETCCSPRLHSSADGTVDGCDGVKQRAAAQANPFTLRTCPDEIKQCLNPGESVTYTLPDGSTSSTTAQDVVTLAKPSPYIYLYVKPDLEVTVVEDGRERKQGCCVTPWCNICPQHYANAFALSLVRESPPSTLGPNTNNALLGTGWPYNFKEDEQTNEVEYETPARPLLIKGPFDRMYPVAPSYVKLHMSDAMGLKPTPEHLEACNNISGAGNYDAVYISGKSFGNSSAEMGFYGPFDKKVYAPVAPMQESPMDYLNRRLMSLGTDVQGLPPLEVKLCSEVIKICTIDDSATSGAGLGDSLSGVGLGVNTGGGSNTGGNNGGGNTGGSCSGTGAPGTCINCNNSAGYVCYDQNGYAISQPSNTTTTTTSPGATQVPSAQQNSGGGGGGGGNLMQQLF